MLVNSVRTIFGHRRCSAGTVWREPQFRAWRRGFSERIGIGKQEAVTHSHKFTDGKDC